MVKGVFQIDRELAVEVLRMVGIDIPVKYFKIEWSSDGDGCMTVMVEYYPAVVKESADKSTGS